MRTKRKRQCKHQPLIFRKVRRTSQELSPKSSQDDFERPLAVMPPGKSSGSRGEEMKTESVE